jgi:hypothetical protein
MSRTLALALAGSTGTDTVAVRPSGYSAIAIHPRSVVEEYWAARALTAETLLSARMSQHVEVKGSVSGACWGIACPGMRVLTRCRNLSQQPSCEF